VIVAVDWDRTVVADGPYDATTPMALLPGARVGLQSLKAAGHLLVLWSARASRALLYNPQLDPLVRAGARRVNLRKWEQQRALHVARYRAMVDFVGRELPGVFDAIDDGAAGKFEFDLVLDDKAFGGRIDWTEIMRLYGAPVYEGAS
jgi:hypothetical protein